MAGQIEDTRAFKFSAENQFMKRTTLCSQSGFFAWTLALTLASVAGHILDSAKA
jgi:hypothetical protein